MIQLWEGGRRKGNILSTPDRD